MRLRTPAAAALLVVLVLLSGCAPGASPTNPPHETDIKVDTAELRAAKKSAAVEDCPTGPTGASELPDLTLPCLGGGDPVDLSSVRGPAVISLWAQWCGPCRREPPAFQRLAETGDVAVLGLDWKETSPGGAIALLDATGATFPQVVDLDGKISDHYRVAGLPGILLVDRDGAVTFRKGSVRSFAELARLVSDNTGVPIAGR